MVTESLGWRPFPTRMLTHFVLGSHFVTCGTENMAIHPHNKLPSNYTKKPRLLCSLPYAHLRVFRTNSVKTGRNEHYTLSDRGSQRVTRKYWFIFVFVCFWRDSPHWARASSPEVSRSHKTMHHSR
jgi:hypothetical protein